MATFVLVHGAVNGAHIFHKVRPLLRKAGHDVFTPSLTGIGERAHLCSPQVDLTTHIQDVVNVVLYEDLSSIVLLGFSYGGCVVTGALEYVGDRVAHLVYLDAFVPEDGQSLNSLTGRRWGGQLGDLGTDWLLWPTPHEYEDAAEAAWSNARQTPHPVGCFCEPVRVSRVLEDYPLSRTYIKATGEGRPDGGGPLWRAGDQAKKSTAWRYREIDTNHSIASNRPSELVELLLELI